MQNMGMLARNNSAKTELFGWKKSPDVMTLYEPNGNTTGIHSSASDNPTSEHKLLTTRDTPHGTWYVLPWGEVAV